MAEKFRSTSNTLRDRDRSRRILELTEKLTSSEATPSALRELALLK